MYRYSYVPILKILKKTLPYLRWRVSDVMSSSRHYCHYWEHNKSQFQLRALFGRAQCNAPVSQWWWRWYYYVYMYVVVRLWPSPARRQQQTPHVTPSVRSSCAAVGPADGHAGRGCLRGVALEALALYYSVLCYSQASQRLDFSSKVGSKTALGPLWMLKSFWGPLIFCLGRTLQKTPPLFGQIPNYF